MPHKKNPIRSERICGIARIVRGYVTPVMEGMPLWHERDISHSSVERIALPDAATATDYLLDLTTGLVEGLVVDPARMRANLDSTGGLIYTSSILLALVDAGMSREDAYALVQAAAMVTWRTGTPLRETLRAEAAAAGQHPGRGRARRGLPAGTLRGAARAGLRAAGAAGMSAPARHRPTTAHLRSLLRQGPRSLRVGRRPAAARRLRPGLRLRPRAADPIPDKGKILTQLSLWWFGQLADLVPNHLVDAEIPAEFAGRAMACRRLSMVPVECVARGYLAGSGLREYRESGAVCGVPLPPGLTEGSRLPEPIFTPATKAPRGQHDENIPVSAVAASVGADVAADLERITLEVYRRGADHRRPAGHPGRRHQDRARLRPGRPAAAGRRGAHPGLVPAVACEPVAAGPASKPHSTSRSSGTG